MTADMTAPRLSTLVPIPLHRRLYGLGSIYGKTLRDSRLGVLVVGGVLGLMVLAGGGEMTSAYGTLAARHELDALAATLPPVMRGLYGNPLNVHRTVRELMAAGAAGCFLEDQVWPKRCGHMRGKRVVEREEYVQKVRAAVDARAGGDFFIVARTDALAVHGSARARGSDSMPRRCSHTSSR